MFGHLPEEQGADGGEEGEGVKSACACCVGRETIRVAYA